MASTRLESSSPLLVFLLFSLLFSECRSILLRNVGVPSYAVQGKEAVLSCDYDLEGQALYAVKWYKNGLEFYRYLPSLHIPMTYYARPGVNVVKDASNERQVTLNHLTMESTGRYRCEVSTEAPSFATVSNKGDMVIVVLPSSGPTIMGGKTVYKPNDSVNVNCTSKESKPAADLFWFINGEPADPSLLVHYPVTNTSRQLHTSTLGLSFKVSDADINSRGDLKFKCTATIASIYWQSNEKSAQGVKRKRASSDHQAENNVEDSSSAHGLSSAFGSSAAATFSANCFFFTAAAMTTIFLNSISRSE